jgi:hypothetical protein
VKNKRGYTAAHMASCAAVLRVLYENGLDVWVVDEKGRGALFTSSFFNRLDCIALLLDLGSPNKKNSTVSSGLLQKDRQGDTALHVACLCGHHNVVTLLLYYLKNESNLQKLRPSDLARKAGFEYLAQLVERTAVIICDSAEDQYTTCCDLFGGNISNLFSILSYYGSRWTKAYDEDFARCYYIDRVKGGSQWERPDTLDLPPVEETRYDKALELLRTFYLRYNPEKMNQVNDILTVYRDRYTELFISLADRYGVTDLSMFKGIDLD